VAVLDCDDFKRVNERYGHTVGDAVLVEVADVLARMVGEVATVGRIWGDAFGLVLTGYSPQAARSLLCEMESQLHARMSAHHWPVTFSVGLSSMSERIRTAAELLADADGLMFTVKRRGRNGIACRELEQQLTDGVPPRAPEFARQP
jgi:diguanylate cyclase (GGDEF)-like protein